MPPSPPAARPSRVVDLRERSPIAGQLALAELAALDARPELVGERGDERGLDAAELGQRCDELAQVHHRLAGAGEKFRRHARRGGRERT